MDADWVGVLEAIYDTETPHEPWLQALANAGLSCFGSVGTAAYTYDARDPARFSFGTVVAAGQTERVWRAYERMSSVPLSSDYVNATYRAQRAASTLESLRGAGAPIEPEQFRALSGFSDVVLANGIDVDGHGLWLGGFVDEYAAIDEGRRAALERVAAHLSAGARLRRRLGTSPGAATERAEAVLTPDGTVQHAVGDARLDEERDALSFAARAIDQARTRPHRMDPTLGLTEWRGLVARRWSLVEVFEKDGKRFLLAQENALPESGSARLTPREREVAKLAALGLGNKLIAYELGITAATVGVLLHRAMKELGLTDRSELAALLQRDDDPA